MTGSEVAGSPATLLLPHRAQQAGFTEAQACLEPCLFQFGDEQIDLCVEYFTARRDAGAKTLLDDTVRFGCRGDGLVGRGNGGHAELEIEQALPNLQRDEAVKILALRLHGVHLRSKSGGLGLRSTAIEDRPDELHIQSPGGPPCVDWRQEA